MSPQERQFLLGQVNRLATADLQKLWSAAARLSDTEFATFMVAAFPQIVDPYVEMSAQFAASWFEESLPTSKYVAVTAPPIPEERLLTSARWALDGSGDEGLKRLQGTTQRAVFDGSRDTTLLNVEKTDSRWARHASAGACAFCRLVATRGAAYTRRETAAKHYHDHDRCIAVEDRDGSYEPPSYAQKWEDEYLKARANAGSGDPKAILSAWRQLDTAESVK